MAGEKKLSKGITGLIEGDHSLTLQKTDELQSLLTQLRYEGRASLGKNFKEARALLDFFKSELLRHIALEERVVFPFLQIHIPKLEPVLHLLRAEHDDFKRNLQSFEFQIEELLKEKDDLNRGKKLERLEEVGTYLAYLLRNHIQVESESVYRVVDRELKAEEKRELEKRVEKGNGKGENR